ncbi:hypothetical protein BN903_12 [Halorubrum sp. AJ67]|nr:hypothetical protein BN903_12 [Halorubrum sp. AJ67]
MISLRQELRKIRTYARRYGGLGGADGRRHRRIRRGSTPLCSGGKPLCSGSFREYLSVSLRSGYAYVSGNRSLVTYRIQRQTGGTDVVYGIGHVDAGRARTSERTRARLASTPTLRMIQIPRQASGVAVE